jgi:hypothetical protein
MARNDPEGAGKKMADIVNTHKLPFEEVKKIPSFKTYVLPHLYCYNLRNSTLAACLEQVNGQNSTIRELYLPDDFNEPIPAKVLEHLTVLVMGNSYNQPLPDGINLNAMG